MDPRELGRLVSLLHVDPDSARTALARSVGDELSKLAYIVLQNRSAAESAAATAILGALERAAAKSWTPEPRHLAEHLAGSVIARAVELHNRTREVDVLEDVPRVPGASFDPRQRAIAAAVTLAGLPVTLAADALGIGHGRARRLMAEAVRVAGSEERLASALKKLAGGGSFTVGDTAFASAAGDAQSPSWLHRRIPAATAAAGAVALVAVALAVLGLGGRAATPQARSASDGSAIPSAGPPRPLDGMATLEDCGISVADSDLAWEGWLTTEQLSPERVRNRASPVYALVTDDTAAWSGPTRMAGPPYRPEGGRLGCAIDPDTGVATAHRLPADWRPPELVDGCPASPFQWFAGYREIGGPNAFVLLPPLSTSWWAEDPSVRILARLSPGPGEGARVTARAEPMGTGEGVDLTVDSPATPAGRQPSPAHYIWVEEVEFPTDGCWILSLAIDGVEVGSAILPVTRHPG